MSSYLQMGNDTENLVGETDLDDFTGIILSPINRKSDELPRDVLRFHDRNHYGTAYDIILDPQLYVPRTQRGHLSEHPYFPRDFDTSDSTNLTWWETLSTDLGNYARSLGVDAVTSPALLPNAWSEDYYAHCVQVFMAMANNLADTQIRPLLTLIVGFGEMESRDNVLSIASIVSGANPSGYYLIIKSDILPGRELTGEVQLAGMMELISALEGTGKPVLVSHCDAEMLLFKAAGATHCATGKHFNLRRFTRTRYEPQTPGGGQLAYWFEQSLLAYLQESDIRRLQRRGLTQFLGDGNSTNYWSGQILDHIDQPEHKKWLKLGWCQYMAWFGKTERALTVSDVFPAVESLLQTADSNWVQLGPENENVIFDDRTNNGSWVRNWLQVLSEYARQQE